ncbi:MAG: DUF3108 domain-containing protein [Zetaproteobacteria bacterium CG_4_9_14_3_um_filter_49_83]|nr:MAG: hypothetical protein AUJ56_04325 [Zetaproteobacteria bacterium CG1_02_49_23]PIQ31637.1 MAG: hypothetical protein COW62_09125 [Zetaproteobacteria bacterium CG17_big_fil_post_rev_8_21_14_2_50_50_13]PIV30154.1 MAG: DUF3108 domain-containing protein [Zetaproteobacteria bacterium CG02_land_8_20_14_3_00_50_9]PIY55503.1 MAG: DUF3108 domain-containing protein [Zetaproteobacteria bacterium CG_4_10_14_0_8_um_filter_49_80]PJA34859.1 MAG: DUF3108 domain-containing protein [Zetaproteobacteria bacter
MKRILLLLLCMGIWQNSAWAVSPHRCFPFGGERLSFDVGWEFVNAGTAILQATTPSVDTYQVSTQANTNKVLDIFKKIRDSIDSSGVCIDQHMQSTLFALNQHERSYHAVKTTVFDWQNNLVHYTQNNKTDDYKVPAGHLNVMDAFFRVRGLDLKPGQTVTIPIFDSRKTYELIVTVEDQTVKLIAPWGNMVECIVVEPKLKTAGIFSSAGTIKLWMTNDDRHIPLQLSAKIKIGRIMGYLTDYQPPASGLSNTQE